MCGLPVIEIDGLEFSTLEEFYEVVSQRLIPGSVWGRNLDAFNDVLGGGFGTPVGGFILRWRNSNLSRRRLGHSETVRQLKKRLTQCHTKSRAEVSRDIAAAENNQGPTVFDWLVMIIREHGDGGCKSESGVLLELLASDEPPN